MNVNKVELYDDFVEKIKLHNLNLDLSNMKDFMLQINVSDLILKYEKIIEYSESYCENVDFQVLFRKVFYENLCDYIMKNNFNSITNIKVIFLIFAYISPLKMCQLIVYIYPLLNEIIQNYFHYEILTIIYKIMINMGNKNNNDYYDLLNELYNKKIIRNPVYTKNEEKENYQYISLFDFFVNSSYICENYRVSLIFVKLILNEIEFYDNFSLLEFYKTSVNVDGLYTLYYNVTEKNKHYIEIIENVEKSCNIYANTFSFFLSKLFYDMKSKKKENAYNIKNQNIYDLVSYYYENILYNSANRNNHYLKMNVDFDASEYVHIISDLFKVNNNTNYMLFIDSFNKSNGFTGASRAFMLIIWYRYIYFDLNKFNKVPILYNTETNIYSIKIDNKKNILNRDRYIEDICLYLNKIKDKHFIYDFLISNMKIYIYEEYPDMIQQCNSCSDKSCSICLENIENKNMNMCTHCKKIFHDTCINNLWKSGHDNCPLCRKHINTVFYTFSNIRYDLIKDILDKL